MLPSTVTVAAEAQPGVTASANKMTAKAQKSLQEKENKGQHIQVVVRARPLTQAEKKQASSSSAVSVYPDRREVVAGGKTFTFDKVFGPESSQIEVYKDVVVPIMEEVLLGYNCTVFAYGQTGTGKTFTMEGERSSDASVSWQNDPLAGIIPRTLSQLFDRLQQQAADFSIKVSMVELYNEELFDLLKDVPEDCQSRLRLYEDPAKKGSVVIEPLEEKLVKSKHEVFDILRLGAHRRQTASTLLNTQSSRSHSVFAITVHIREVVEGEELLKIGKLNLVDLAGSENIGRSGAVEKRAREAGQINQSLLTLGRVINALVEHAPHVPYRESKLTRILQDSLGGRTKTSIIATVSPAKCNLEETLSTLDYAHRAKNITNRPEINQRLTRKALLKEYTDEIDRLRKDLAASRDKNGIFVHEDNYNYMTSRLETQDEAIKDLEERIVAKMRECVEMSDLFSSTKAKLEKVSARFDAAKDKLKATKRALHQTTYAKEEQEFLVTQHAEFEQNLGDQAEQLLAVSEMTTADLDLLHAKLDAMKATDNANATALEQFSNDVDEKIEKLHTSLDAFSSAERIKLEARKKDIDAAVTKHGEDLALVQSLIGRLFASLQSAANETCRQSKDVAKHADTFADSACGDGNSFQDSATVSINAFYNQTIVETVAKLLGLLGDLTLNMSSLKLKLSGENESLLAALSFQAKLQEDSWKQLADTIRNHELLLVKTANNGLAAIADAPLISANFDAAFQKYEQQMVDMTANLADLKRQKAAVFGAMLPGVDSSVKQLIEQERAHVSDCEKLQTRLASELSTTQTDVKMRVADTEGTVDSSNALLAASKLELSDFQATAKKSVADIGQVITGHVELVAENCAKYKTETATKVQSFETAVMTSLDSHKTSLVGIGNQAEQANASAVSFLASQKTSLDICFETAKEQLDAVDDDVSELANRVMLLMDEELDTVESSGETPSRKSYRFPKNLATLSPEERLMSRFHDIKPVPPLDGSFLNDSILNDSTVTEDASAGAVCNNNENDDAASIASSNGTVVTENGTGTRSSKSSATRSTARAGTRNNVVAAGKNRLLPTAASNGIVGRETPNRDRSGSRGRKPNGTTQTHR